MIIHLKNGMLVEISNPVEIDMFLKRVVDGKSDGSVDVPVKVMPKKHKKHMHLKTCDVCGRVCKGFIGYGVHRSTMHGIKPETAIVTNGKSPMFSSSPLS